jgi:transposase
MRCVHLRGWENILKRVLIHLGGFNLALVMRQLLSKDTPRGLQGLSADSLLILLRFWIAILVPAEQESTSLPLLRRYPRCASKFLFRSRPSEYTTSATGC